MIDLQGPILIIGSGRSGTTLLASIFDHHSDISFFGETFFLAPHIWSRLFNKHDLVRKFNVDWRGRSAGDASITMESERTRLNRLVAEFMVKAIRADPFATHWGYKEIWNGGKIFEAHDWAIYDEIFPRAHWVHIVRNPVVAVRSSAGLIGMELIERDYLDRRLEDWVRTHEYCRQRRSTGRYVMIRYEDLIDDPEEAVGIVFAELGIDWDSNCLKALNRRHVPSKTEPLFAPDNKTKPLDIEGLAAMVDELGYAAEISRLGIEILDREITRVDEP